jgi:glycosyltransferase involved in cell wall biosynthesis
MKSEGSYFPKAVPLVSVVIPTYNRAHTVGRAVESVLLQSHRPLEVIVVDDGSTDNTLEILESYGDRIKVLRQPNGGPSAARNEGVAQAKGEIIAFLDSDDAWKPEKLERQVRLMMIAGPNVPCCVCNAETMIAGRSGPNSFDIAGVTSGLSEGYWLNPAELIATRFLLFNQVVAIRRAAFEKIGGFKKSMRILEDHDLAFRLSLLGPWAFISEPMVTKYDESDGIGVQARQNAAFHAEAWKGALEGFMEEPLDDKENIKFLIRRCLDDVAIEIRALAMQNVTAASIVMLFLRVKGAIRRRMSSWPKPDAVTNLEQDKSGNEAIMPALS